MRVTIGVKIFGIAVGFADPGLTVTVLNASQGSSQLTLRWRKVDSNCRSRAMARSLSRCVTRYPAGYEARGQVPRDGTALAFDAR
jgi:hypothetical protein